jgi:putative phosphoesterase
MRAVTRTLGTARDADVQIDFLADWLERASDFQAPGIGLCLEEKRRDRATLQIALAGALNEMEEAGAVEDMRMFLSNARASAGTEGESSGAYQIGASSVRERIDELLAHEPYLEDEGALREHHAMRIAAKRLRYTLEAFRPLFEDGLQEELGRVKRMQEMLGEIHDMDVWVEYLENLLGKVGGERLAGLLAGRDPGAFLPGMRFLRRRCAERRKELFKEFVQYWGAMRQTEFLLLVQGRFACQAASEGDICAGLVETVEKAPRTKIAVLGDVHANLHALQAVLEDAEEQGASIIIDTGDQVGYGAMPEEVIDLLRDRRALSVIGNYDLKVFRVHAKRGARPFPGPSDKLLSFRWAYDQLSEGSREHLLSLPAEVRLEALGKMILITHGSPGSMDEYVGPMTSKGRLREIAQESNADILICGHSHRPFLKQVGGTVILNPGSVGRQEDGDPRAAYALLTLDPLKVELRRISYDIKGAAEAIRSKGLPESFAQMIVQGRSYDLVAGLEPPRPARTESERLRLIKEVAASYLGEDAHSEKVRRLALMIFEGVRTELMLGSKERYWLECAAILHDVGWIEGRKDHHQTSLRIILEEEDLPFRKKERRIVGLVARYHRKGLPSNEDAHYATLEEGDRRTVDRLAAILRVADGLDATHTDRVASLRCHVTTDSIIIHLAARGDAEMEEREAFKKGDLLQRVAGRALRIVREEPS